MSQEPLPRKKVKRYRSIGHHLKPVVTVSGNGLSESVITEIERALTDHELIKIKLVTGDRDEKGAWIDQLLKETGAREIQRIGNITLIYKAATKPNEKLSNLKRFSHIT